MPSKNPAYLIRFPGTLREDLKKEAEALNTGIGSRWTLAGYIVHLLSTHPDRKRKPAKAR